MKHFRMFATIYVLLVAASAGLGDPPKQADPKKLDIRSAQVMKVVASHCAADMMDEVLKVTAVISQLLSEDPSVQEKAEAQIVANPARFLAIPPKAAAKNLIKKHKALGEKFQRLAEKEDFKRALASFQQATKLVKARSLLDDARYLANILAEQEGWQRRAVHHRLKLLTGQDLPDKPEQWIKWLEKEGFGAASYFRPGLVELLGLRQTNSKLQWDTAHWQELTSEKAILDLAERYEKLLKSRGQTPNAAKQWVRWVKPDTDLGRTRLMLVRVLARSDEFAFPGGRASKNGHDLSISAKGLTIRSKLADGGQYLLIRERFKPQRRMLLMQSEVGDLSLVMMEPGNDTLVLIAGKDGQTRSLYKGQHRQAKNWDAFCRRYPNYTQDVLQKRFGVFGVAFPMVKLQARADENPVAATVPVGRVKMELPQSLRDGVQRVLGLTYEGGKLSVDGDLWQRSLDRGGFGEAEANRFRSSLDTKRMGWAWSPADKARVKACQSLIEQLPGLLGEHTGGGHGMGGGKITTHVEFEVCRFNFTFRPGAYSVRYQPRRPRTLEVLIDGLDEQLQIEVTDMSTGLLLRLGQDRSGKVRLLELGPDAICSLQADSWVDFYLDYRSYVTQRLWPLLADCGVSLPPLLLSPIWGQAAAAALAPAEMGQGKAKELIAQLESPRFKVREQASKTLTEHPFRYAKAVEKALQGTDRWNELGVRLKEIADNHRRLRGYLQISSDDPLLQNRRYLQAIAKLVGPEDRKILDAHVEKLDP